MTEAEQREAARRFINKWTNKGREDEDDRSYWIEMLQNVLGQSNVTDRLHFQKKVVVNGNTKRIDAYIEETKVIIEQKSLGIALDKPQAGHDGMTPYEQAKQYNDNLPVSEKARWIVLSNFAEMWIFDMDTRVPEQNIIVIRLDELQDKYHMLNFLIKEKVQKINEELELSMKAGEIVGKLHSRFLEQYNNPNDEQTQHSLNVLCTRLVFCLYAEDAGLFGDRNIFEKYISQYEPKDVRRALLDMFNVLNTPEDERQELYLDDELAAFPYCNGGLFASEEIEIPKITPELKQTLLDSTQFDWSKISPTIFGAVFESTLNPETRRSGGMHYTSIENIHKVIDPLFLDGLTAELDEIIKIGVQRTRENKLRDFQNKLAALKFLDPAAGSGNFLTESYLCLRRLENKAVAELQRGQIEFGFEAVNPIKVGINQFYGIEINDFAATVAKTALWIAESQMLKETEDIVHTHIEFLPLKANANIVEGNALRMDWEDVVPKEELSYIMGNPPFVGARLMAAEQKADVLNVFGSTWKNVGNLDYVSCWYKMCVDYMKDTNVRAALVSTNSISQGEAVAILWEPLFANGVHIDFAYQTFRWDSEASSKAHVHCVIVGFSIAESYAQKVLFIDGQSKVVHNINGYLIEADDIFVGSRSKPLCAVPKIGIGNKPIDGGYYLFTKQEMEEFIKKEPAAEAFFKLWYGAKEFINRSPRYCLWLGDCSPDTMRKMPHCLERVANVRDYRKASTSAGTRKLAERPARFHVENMPTSTYIIIPRVSSENRRYIPMGFLSPEALTSDSAHIIPDATLYHFGVLMSNVHMAWMRAVAGRLKSDYRYSKDIVYNNFPWPTPTADQQAAIERTAQGILDARALYPDSSLADLYDPLTMPIELKRAHQTNDRAVMEAYGFDVKNTSEADCVAALMKMYQELVGGHDDEK